MTIQFLSASLPGIFHADPADRIITVTAMTKGLPLIAKDEKILNSPTSSGQFDNKNHAKGSGSKLTRKPPKLFMANTNLLRTVGGRLQPDDPIVSQLAGLKRYHLQAVPKGDLRVDEEYLFETGGSIFDANQQFFFQQYPLLSLQLTKTSQHISQCVRPLLRLVKNPKN